MKRFVFVLCAVVLLIVATQAEAGILNSKENFKAWANTQSLHTGAWYDYRDSEFTPLVGLSLYDFKLLNQNFSVNAGYTETDFTTAGNAKVLGYVNADLGPIIGKVLHYIPTYDIPGIEMTYSVGFGGGYDLYDEDLAVGNALLGAKLHF